MKWTIFILSFVSNNYIFTMAKQIQDLTGTWNLKSSEEEYNFPVTVPGGIYTDLMQNNVINDVFYGFNDIETRWVSKTNWSYFRTFTVEPKIFEHTNINIVFDGVDTFSKILINDKEIGTTENMFLRYIFNIKPYLKVGDNHIEVQFTSAVTKSKALFEEQAKNYPILPLCVPPEYNGECHANHIRKMQASFSWDWGPALPSVGIWKKVYLEAYDSTVLRDVTVNISPNSATNNWDIEFYIYLAENSENLVKGDLSVRLLTNVKEEIWSEDVTVTKNDRGDFLHILRLSVPQSSVDLWWPNGYGEATLYNVEVNYTSPNNEERDSRTLRIGFRTVELSQRVIESGSMFYFIINDVPIFGKGSNSIPINILPELGQSEDTIRFLLQSAKDVHMNMLRVWGGGNYEADIFYELADEMGILIWQDFMFACSMYPTDDAFLRIVTSEVKHQVRRLQHHPSLVLWAGNNENEAALRQNWYGTKDNFSVYADDYRKLYVATIEKELLLNDNTRVFLTSSPTNGIKSIEENYVAEDPQSHFYGDVHYYNYVDDSWSGSTFPINRFASEYGYQSLPNIETLFTATNNTEDLIIGSKFLESRQHLPEGFDKMKVLISNRLQLPSSDNKNYSTAFIYYSQIMQAMSVKIQTEYYRQWRGIINNEGKGYTMGALYWQLNDVWVAPTWSGIDFKNNWKMLHYYAKHFFAPVIITGDISKDGNLHIYVVSDLLTTISNAIVAINVFKWDSFDTVHYETLPIDVRSSDSKKIKSLNVEKYLSQIHNEPCGEKPLQNCFLYFTLTDSGNNPLAPDNFVFPSPLKSTAQLKPTIRISQVKEIKSTEFIIEIETSAVSLFVWLEAKGIRGRFSDNGFLQITATKIVHFSTEKPTNRNDLVESLTISNLMEFQTPKVSGASTASTDCTLLIYAMCSTYLLLKYLKY